MKEKYFVLSGFVPEKPEEFTLGELHVCAGESFTEQGVVLDSFDWLLWRAGLVLVASPSALCLYGETEISEARKNKHIVFIDDLPDGAVKDIVRPLTGQRIFARKAECSLKRSLFDVLNEDGKTVARFEVLDVEMESEHCRFSSLFIKTIPLKGFLREDSLIQASIEDAGGKQIKMPPLYYAIKKSGLDPALYKTKITAEGKPDTPVEKELKIICTKLLGVMEQNEFGAMDGRDPEFLHDYRVALRRIRSAVSMLRGILPDEKLSPLKERLSALFGATGDLRDLDVYLAHMAEYRNSLPNDMTDSLNPVSAYLRKAQAKERRKLAKLFESADYAETKDTLRAFLLEDITDEGASPVKPFAVKAVRKAYGQIVRQAVRLHGESEAAEIHKIRISCKKLRYALEFFDIFFPERERERAGRKLKKLQDTLGAHQDYEVQRGKLLYYSAQAVKGAKEPLELSVACGYLVRLLDEKQNAEREKSLKLIADFTSPKMRKTFKDMTGL